MSRGPACGGRDERQRQPQRCPGVDEHGAAGLRRLLPGLYLLTSMLALGYEIVWLRLLDGADVPHAPILDLDEALADLERAIGNPVP